MKWLAILFTLFILLVIVLADAGILAHYVGFIYEVPFGDKAGHFILYGILALLLDLALFRARPDQNRRQLAIRCGLVLALLIGLEEFSQQYFSSRTFDLVDLTFSYLGVAFFSWLALIITK
jgi:polysaccharide biosynthesis protein VpsQ